VSSNTPVTVVVVFYSRGGATENLAHAAAVGAVQARALIRLRRVADIDDTVLARFADWRDAIRRMHKEYVAPKEGDILAADALIVGSPADVSASAPEWKPFVDLLTHLHAQGKLAGKVAAAIPNDVASESFAELFQRLGLQTASGTAATDPGEVGRTVALGREVATTAKNVKRRP
jgi:multimeric flavodoxin WrbA